jgi:hypothetical protein
MPWELNGLDQTCRKYQESSDLRLQLPAAHKFTEGIWDSTRLPSIPAHSPPKDRIVKEIKHPPKDSDTY